MNPEQRYLFDSRGVFTIPGALTLSHVRLSSAKHLPILTHLPARALLLTPRPAPPRTLPTPQVDELNQIFSEVEEADSPSLGGAGHMGGDALHWGRAYRDLLDMPHISPILEELIGNHRPSDIPSFRIDRKQNLCVCARARARARVSRLCAFVQLCFLTSCPAASCRCQRTQSLQGCRSSAF
jgi:hypothetical protein